MASIGLLSCTSARQPDAVSHTMNVRVPVPDGFFTGAAWLPNGRLVFELSTSKPYSTEIWQGNDDGSNLQRLILPDDPSCRVTQYQYAMAMSDGRLALTKRCALKFDDPRVGLSSVVAYEFKDRTVTELADLGDRMALNGSSWNADASQGVGAQSSGICARIAWLTRNGPQGIAAAVSDGGTRWRLDDWLTQPRESCETQGRADCPVWQPGGQLIAFFASPPSKGVTGQARLDVPWQLYLLDSQSLRVMKVVDGIYGTCRGMSWSRDGRWLAFTGKIGGTEGIWLYSMGNRALRLVAVMRPSSPDWSPDGRKLIAVEDPTLDYPPKTHLTLADVAAVTHRS
jgi:hypothetical protein